MRADIRNLSRCRAWLIVACALCVAIGGLAWTPKAHSISAPIHISGTAGEGVFIRPEANTSRPAIGWMPEGASPDYHCFVWGQNINGVPIWFNVTYNGVTGYYASYYDDSSYHSNEELTAKYGIPLCGSGAPTPPPSSPGTPPATPPGGSGSGSTPPTSTPTTEAAGAPRIRSVFYSGTDSRTGLHGLPAADHNLGLNEWRSDGICTSSRAVNIPSGVEILAGWSRGRLGPAYFLDGARARWEEIHWIILFDPGNASEMQGNCDETLDINALLADWLKSNPRNHLVVLAGRRTEEKTFGYWGHPDFQGLWKYYLAGIWNQYFAEQALICDYDNMDHEDVLRKFSWIIRNPLDSCPTADGAPTPVAWHP